MPQPLKTIFTNSFRKRYLALCQYSVFFWFSIPNFSVSNVELGYLCIFSNLVGFVKNMGIVVDDVEIEKDEIEDKYMSKKY